MADWELKPHFLFPSFLPFFFFFVVVVVGWRTWIMLGNAALAGAVDILGENGKFSAKGCVV